MEITVITSAEHKSATSGSDPGSPELLQVLELMCQGADIPYDPTRAKQFLRRAEQDIPPTVSRAARRRLIQTAEALGLQVVTRQMSIREAFAAVDRSPLALFAVMADGSARWHVLLESRGRQGCFAALGLGEQDTKLTAEQWAERLGLSDENTLVEWMVAQPATHAAPEPDEHVDQHHDAHPEVPPLRRLWKLFRPEARDIGIIIIYAIGVGILSLATPITVLAVVNTTAMATLLQQLLVLCLGLLVSLCLAGVLRVLQTVVVEYLQQRVFVRVAADLAYRLPRIDIQAFDQHHGPELMNRFFDVLTVQKASATLLLDGVNVVLQMVIGLAMLAAYHQLLLGFDVLLVAGLLFMVFALGRGAVASSIRESISKYQVAAWLEEMARNPSAFKSNGASDFAFEHADVLVRQYLVHRRGHFRIILRQFACALSLQVLASAGLLGLGGYLVIQGQLTLGQLVAAEIVVSLVVASFTKMGKQLESYYDLIAAVDKLGHLTDLPLERRDGTAYRPGSGGMKIETHNLTYGYGGGHHSVFSGLNLSLTPGERVAVVGPNGAGKSTLIELLVGERAPVDGYIQIDGQDLRDVRLDSFRRHVAIAKGIEIFDGTVIDNVQLGRDELTLADVREALTQVDLLRDILSLPDGLRTRLSVGGSPLSLGQAERLMLARAIAGRPRLLILDELLDDMDRQVRHEVLPAILNPQNHWTLLVITHSDEVAKLCDRQIHLTRSGEHARHES